MKTAVTLRLSPADHAVIKAAAASDSRSINNWCVRALLSAAEDSHLRRLTRAGIADARKHGFVRVADVRKI